MSGRMRFSSVLATVALPAALLLVSCGSPHYKGYQTRSYNIRGQHYQPLTIKSALYYSQEGIASWYDESKFFGLKRGNTSLGERGWGVSISQALTKHFQFLAV